MNLISALLINILCAIGVYFIWPPFVFIFVVIQVPIFAMAILDLPKGFWRD